MKTTYVVTVRKKVTISATVHRSKLILRLVCICQKVAEVETNAEKEKEKTAVDGTRNVNGVAEKGIRKIHANSSKLKKRKQML